ncbi:MAG: glycosyltransferase family A protein [Proteobacteria bacterium]|nr:glycosyltransferase family A protein [Pseudomonadota bacterium]
MIRPRFSIVIPTRNRAHELHHTLRTCLGQVLRDPGRDTFEVVVGDNDSSEDIRGVVDAFGSPLVRYVRTPGYLSMVRSWEFSVGHASGEYVGIVCTDDALLLDGLQMISDAIAASDAPVVTYQHAYYYWPTYAREELRRRMLVPAFVFPEGLHDSEALIEESLRTLYYARLPCFLNSFCRRDVLEEARARAGGLFGSLCPDIYSGFLLAAVSGKVHVLPRIVGVGGVSAGSTGGNAQLDPLGTATQAFFNDYKDDPLLPGLMSFPFTASAILDSAVKALNRLGRNLTIAQVLHPDSYVDNCYRQAMLYPAAAQDIAMASIDEFLASQPDGGSALRRRLLLRRMQWSIKDNLPAWAVRPLQKAWHRARQGSGALAAVGHDGTGELLFDDVYEAARHLSGRHAG